MLRPQLKQLAEPPGFFVPQRVQYISTPEIDKDETVNQRGAQGNDIPVGERPAVQANIIAVIG
jgi:hypothetical protein